ncbi:MAG: RsiV family protein [Treponema sp.]|jgi:hypothetical protein|nr:RsiV family protein [Treponema sp.]
MKRYAVCCVFALIVLNSACVSVSRSEKSPYNHWHYTFTVLLDPEKLNDSPQLDIALSLLYMEYPAEQAEYLNDVLYSTSSFDVYKDRIIQEQRKKYRSSLSEVTEPSIRKNMAGFNWRYAETVNIKSPGQGLILERDFDVYSGGPHGLYTKRYYVIDMDDCKLLKIDDFFSDYQRDKRIRDIVYFELGKYSGLESGQKLSEGIFFSDEPELTFNFFVTSEGLGLHWDPYQIAPYSQGNIEVIVPWQVIRPLMLVGGIQLLTKFGIYLFV